MQTTMYRSVDGGKTFAAYRGTPSGEDDHVLWIAPDDSERMILGTDQGVIISLNGGQSWSTWYNQATGQLYHVITDNSFPYYAYSSQQDSGSVVVPNRSDFGQITYREWFSTGSFESGYIAPDPANSNLIYSIGWFGTVLRMDRTTKQISTVFVPGAKYHYTWETPIVFSPKDTRALYLGMQHLLRTTDGAVTWQEISPDLTAKPATASALRAHASNSDDEEEDEQPQATAPGTIQAISPSPLQAGQIWVGTSTGLVQLTRDGGATWSNVTPPELPPRSRVFLIEASPLDALTAYAVAAARNDLHPYIYRTRDAGKTWQKIVAGLPLRGIARVVREDPARKGLLYAGTETGADVSFDGGDHWQPLQLNLPTTSVRDLAVHGTDLVAATYGRGLWILDDLSPLRQMNAKATDSQAHLFRPETALRVRWDNWQETPLSAETPAGQNPPDGAIINYYLKASPSKEITLEIHDARGNLVRRYSSTPPPADKTPKNVPDFWFAPPEALPAKAGLNRFVWNLRFPHPATLPYGYYGQPLDYLEYTVPDNAIAGETPSQQPPGALVVPGNYEVLLTVDGKTYRQPLVVNPDPRLRIPQADLEAQLSLAKNISDWMETSYRTYNEAASLQNLLAERQKSRAANALARDATDASAALFKELEEIKEGTSATAGVGSVNRDLARFLTMIESGDMRPAESARNAARASCEALRDDLLRWQKVNALSLPALNNLLKQQNLAALPAATTTAQVPMCSN